MNRDECLVIDTTCLISAVLNVDGKTAQAVKLAREKYEIALSPETIRELEKVFRKEKFDKFDNKQERLEFLREFRKASSVYEQTINVGACRDPNDDMFLSLALSCGAKTIISSDKDLRDMAHFQGIDILSAAQFLERELQRDKAERKRRISRRPDLG